MPCPIGQIDNFAMRNFTNDAVFDDTLPVADGVLEAGLRVPLPLLQRRMEEWFRRKQCLRADETLRVSELAVSAPRAMENACRPDETSLLPQLPGPR